jgi:hypothetical protein
MIFRGSPFLDEQVLAVKHEDRNRQVKQPVDMGLELFHRIERTVTGYGGNDDGMRVHLLFPVSSCCGRSCCQGTSRRPRVVFSLSRKITIQS